MIDIDRFEELADKLTCELPEIFFRDLNGGVNILEYIKVHPQSTADAPMFILGEYHYTHETGRSIFIYYGSFMRMYPDASEETLKKRLQSTLRHEFRHHLESLAGDNTLMRKDRAILDRYLGKEEEKESKNKKRNRKFPKP